jgi:8-amino-7-oxononanoate synthase
MTGKDDLLDLRSRARLKARQDRNALRKLSARPSDLIDFSSNDYLSLSTNADLRARFLNALLDHSLHTSPSANHLLGSGGSRLLDGNSDVHSRLEDRLVRFFSKPCSTTSSESGSAALLFNSGLDANVGIFSSVPQAGDAIVYDTLIHASVHDGMRASRVKPTMRIPFAHNSVSSLNSVISQLVESNPNIRTGRSCVFIAVEALYSMDGDFSPLREIVTSIENLLPLGNGYLIVDEAHSTGIYGPKGRGLVSLLGLEDKILIRLHTFGKAMASNGGIT